MGVLRCCDCVFVMQRDEVPVEAVFEFVMKDSVAGCSATFVFELEFFFQPLLLRCR